MKGENLPIYHIPRPRKDLEDFTTTEKDMKKKTNRHPGPEFRALSEDQFTYETTSQVKQVTEKMSSLSTNESDTFES
jgi:hypothetical protein